MDGVKTAVVLIIFRRPDTTQRVFQAIRDVRPKQLFIVADGPRSDIRGEREKCQATRRVVAKDNIDWDCKVYRNYADENMGCKHRFVSGLDWVFEQVDEAIILEDDCLPNNSFFRFQDAMIEKYRSDNRIMHVAGTNMGVDRSFEKNSYYFSKQTFIWGWGTWKRAWKKYDAKIEMWKNLRKEKNIWKDILVNKREIKVRKRLWNRVFKGEIDTWDYQWLFNVLVNGGMSVVPNDNLVSNIGFGIEAVHTSNTDSPFSNLPLEKMSFPLNHPDTVLRDVDADKEYIESMYCNSVSSYIKHVIKRIRN